MITVRVCRVMCETCIFRPSSNFQTAIPERIAEMIEACKTTGIHVPCHSTIDYDDVDDDDATGAGSSVLDDGPAAICKGMADRYPPQILQLAQRMEGVRVLEVDPPMKGES